MIGKLSAIVMEQLKSTSNIKTLHILDTKYHADSIEWCPHEPCKHIFVCANYQLDDSSKESDKVQSRRFGRILLYSVAAEKDPTLHQIIETDGVLDQKWCHNKINGHSILGVVNAKNTLQIYKLDSEIPELQLVTSVSNDETETLMLSLDWSTGKYSSEEPMIVTSDSRGKISLFDFKENKLIKKSQWDAHGYEAWICAFYYWDSSIIFTGGDDSKLMKFDTRVGTEPLLKSNAHSAGVTSLHSNKEKEYILASGSYDTYLNIWDIRKMKSSLSCIEMPDCVWRLKWNPHDYNHLLAACMRKGFHVVDATDVNNPDIVANYYEHEDLAYGVDWSYMHESEIQQFSEDGNHIIGACSFYDHKLSVAKINLKTCK